MSPVLPLSAPRFILAASPRSFPRFTLPTFCPNEPNPIQEAGAPSEGATGWCKGSLESPRRIAPRLNSKLLMHHWWA